MPPSHRGPPRRIDRDDLARRWAAGETPAAIARALNTSPATVRAVASLLRRSGDQRCAPRTDRQLARGRQPVRPPAPLPVLRDADARWIAGLLDVAGSIGLANGTLYLQVRSRRRGVAVGLLLATGVGAVSHRAGRARHATAWTWMLLRAEPVIALLRAVRPYLRARGATVDAWLRWPIAPRGRPLSAEIEQQRSDVIADVAAVDATEDLPVERDDAAQ